MTYLNQWQLTFDGQFTSRGRAALINQATVFQNDARQDFVALANAILVGTPAAVFATWQSVIAASPGFVDAATVPDGIDSSLIPDEDILAAIQAQWPTVADLYFNSDGTPKG
jgi:hypothetical protein